MAGTDSSIRLTIAGGKQADARLQVIDEFSGLALLKCDATPDNQGPAKPLEFANETPAVGGGVMTASGWGVEQPLVSLGIVAGTERNGRARTIHRSSSATCGRRKRRAAPALSIGRASSSA